MLQKLYSRCSSLGTAVRRDGFPLAWASSLGLQFHFSPLSQPSVAECLPNADVAEIGLSFSIQSLVIKQEFNPECSRLGPQFYKAGAHVRRSNPRKQRETTLSSPLWPLTHQVVSLGKAGPYSKLCRHGAKVQPRRKGSPWRQRALQFWLRRLALFRTQHGEVCT